MVLLVQHNDWHKLDAPAAKRMGSSLAEAVTDVPSACRVLVVVLVPSHLLRLVGRHTVVGCWVIKCM